MFQRRLISALSLVLATVFAVEAKMIVPEDVDLDSNLTQLVLDIKQERDFNTLYVLRQHSDDCGFINNFRHLQIPRLLLRPNQNYYLKHDYSSEFLAIVCLNQVFSMEDLVEKLSQNFNHMRNNQIVFVWKQSTQELPRYMRYMYQLAELCIFYEMINVIIVFHDFPVTHQYYSFNRYPKVVVETRNFLNRTESIYPERLRNMRGQPILTATDWVEPRSMLYYEEDGSFKQTGYMMKFLYAFAEKLNATIEFPVPNKESLYLQVLTNLTRNRTIDFALSLYSPKIEMNILEYTYPIETAIWNIIWPNEPLMSPAELYFHILEPQTTCALAAILVVFSALLTWTSAQWWTAKDKCRSVPWLECIVNDMSLRAMLGQSFSLNKHCSFKYRLSLLLTIVSGFIISNMYIAFLGSVFVEPPPEHRMASYDDILKSPHRIAMVERNVPELKMMKGPEFWKKYKDCFFIIDTYEEFVFMRHALNTSYGYSLMSSLWPVVKQQQQHFARNIFRISEDIIFDSFNIIGLPIGENSVYKDVINEFIGDTKTHGLMDHWFVSTFMDMWISGKISLVDNSNPHVVDAMKLEDFVWIWHAYILANFVAIVVFICECLFFKRQMKQIHKDRSNKRRAKREKLQINFGKLKEPREIEVYDVKLNLASED